MKRILCIAGCIAALMVSCTKTSTPYDYVDVTIGSGGHGHVFVGASVPFGMVQLGPTSIPQTWDWCSGYHISDSSVIGFSHTHLSGTGVGDLFDVTVMPVVGKDLEYSRVGLSSKGDRDHEVAEPAYYSVPLERYGVLAEMTATERVGFERFTFPKGAEDAAIVFDLENGGCWDEATDVAIEVIDNTHIIGHRFSKGWADDQKLWFAAEFSTPFTDYETFEGKYWRFNYDSPSVVEVKVALSPTSTDAASSNMIAELPGWDFEAVVAAGRKKWNTELDKIDVKTDDESRKTIFYTSLYHTMVMPSLFSDVDKRPSYTALSLWDTYRAAMPLFTIIHPDRENDVINSFLDIFDKQGDLPVWHLMSCETDCMVGNPGIPVVADAIVKGFDGFDVEKAYQAMKTTALTPDRGQDLRMKYGYIPSDLFNESVAYETEYALADGALAEAAKYLGKTEDYEHFLNRSHSYRRHFDPKTCFLRGVNADGSFKEPFNPFYSNHRHDDYCEGNAWQYLFLVPQDIKGLCSLFAPGRYDDSYIDHFPSGRDTFLKKLDSLFIQRSTLDGDEVSGDISGLIGQYAHGNEPSHHILYIYTMLGQPWKTADLVHKVLTELYTTEPDGLCGNEDAGQMSAWYILSSLGFYQAEPAGGRYWFGTPLFNEATVALPGNLSFRIVAEGLSDEARYIKKVYLNGCPYTKPYIDYKSIMAGGELRLEMSVEPALWYCWNEPKEYVSQRPENPKFSNKSIENKIAEVCALLTNPRLRWMFANCFPNTLDTTVNFREDDGSGHPDTFVITGDIFAMWLRDSGAQVWPYLRFAAEDEQIRKMLEGTIRRQLFCLTVDPYANAFNFNPTGSEWESDGTDMNPYNHERKWEIDSQCYPIRLAYEYWKKTGDSSVFDTNWITAMDNILRVLREQQRKDGRGSYYFTRECDRQYDMKCNYGYGNPVNPVGLIVSSFRPSDDATVLDFLIPSNFFAVTSLRKAAEILETVNNDASRAESCRSLASEVEEALKKYAIVEHPEFGKIYAFEVDGFGNYLLIDDANVPSLLAMSYLGDVDPKDPIYQNTRRFVLSPSNPYRFEGPAGVGIGGPHIGPGYIWPMSIMMRAFTSDDDGEILDCILSLMTTDAGTGFMHEAFHVNDPSHFTRTWFAWQNTLFGELILKLIDDGKLDLLNSII